MIFKGTPGPWEYIASNENHGPYVCNAWGSGDICDGYVMSKPDSFSIRNGGDSKPIKHQNEEGDANMRLVAAAPELLEALTRILTEYDSWKGYNDDGFEDETEELARAAIAKALGEQK
jgi:hypothetical protein